MEKARRAARKAQLKITIGRPEDEAGKHTGEIVEEIDVGQEIGNALRQCYISYCVVMPPLKFSGMGTPKTKNRS